MYAHKHTHTRGGRRKEAAGGSASYSVALCPFPKRLFSLSAPASEFFISALSPHGPIIRTGCPGGLPPHATQRNSSLEVPDVYDLPLGKD